MPPRPILIGSRPQGYDATLRRFLLDNPVFANGSGSALAGTPAATGTVPANWRAVCNGGACAASVAASADGLGNDVALAVTFSAAGDRSRLDQVLDSAKVSRWAPGDIVEGFAEVSIVGTPTNLAGVQLQLQCNTDLGTQNSYSLYSETGGTGSEGADKALNRLVLKTQPTRSRPAR